jgi:hypothetical protein
MIAITPISILIGLAAAVVGFLEVIIADRLVYPAVRKRHELRKVTGRQGTDPAIVMQILKVQSLVLLPILGLLFGEHMFGAFVRNMMQ